MGADEATAVKIQHIEERQTRLEGKHEELTGAIYEELRAISKELTELRLRPAGADQGEHVRLTQDVRQMKVDFGSLEERVRTLEDAKTEATGYGKGVILVVGVLCTFLGFAITIAVQFALK